MDIARGDTTHQMLHTSNPYMIHFDVKRKAPGNPDTGEETRGKEDSDDDGAKMITEEEKQKIEEKTRARREEQMRLLEQDIDRIEAMMSSNQQGPDDLATKLRVLNETGPYSFTELKKQAMIRRGTYVPHNPNFVPPPTIPFKDLREGTQKIIRLLKRSGRIAAGDPAFDVTWTRGDDNFVPQIRPETLSELRRRKQPDRQGKYLGSRKAGMLVAYDDAHDDNKAVRALHERRLKEDIRNLKRLEKMEREDEEDYAGNEIFWTKYDPDEKNSKMLDGRINKWQDKEARADALWEAGQTDDLDANAALKEILQLRHGWSDERVAAFLRKLNKDKEDADSCKD